MDIISLITSFLKEKVALFLKPREEKAKYQQLFVYLKDKVSGHGHNLDEFAERVRVCFVESQCHYARLKYGKAIAERHGWDMSVPQDRRTLWKTLAKEYVIARIDQGRWAAEGLDRPINPMITYANKIALQYDDFRIPSIDDPIELVRAGIARTLVFIRVFPPKTDAKPFDADENHEDLKRCWEILRDHNSYKNHKRILSQHALDCVYDDRNFRQSLWIEPTEIGQLKQWIEGDSLEVDARLKPLLFTWLMFKYATLFSINTDNFQGVNPHHWLWNKDIPGYRTLWGTPNG